MNLKSLKGRVIIGVRFQSDEERAASTFKKRAPVLILDDGTVLVPIIRDEKNKTQDAGALMVCQYDGKQSRIDPK